METPVELRYSAEHLWVHAVKDGVVVTGITDFAQEQLGEVVYVDLPDVATMVTQGEPFGVVESVKAVSDLFAPVSGEVVARNDALDDTPESVNRSPYGDAWMLQIRPSDPGQLDGLLDAAGYTGITSDA
jgi:glycine cleavage system H protein